MIAEGPVVGEGMAPPSLSQRESASDLIRALGVDSGGVVGIAQVPLHKELIVTGRNRGEFQTQASWRLCAAPHPVFNMQRTGSPILHHPVAVAGINPLSR